MATTSPCVGPLVYHKRDNTTAVAVTTTCTSTSSANTSSVDVWYPNATYMQILHGPWEVETVLNGACVPVTGQLNVFRKADCNRLTFEHYGDATCVELLPDNALDPEDAGVRTCYVPSSASTTITSFNSTKNTTTVAVTNIITTPHPTTAEAAPDDVITSPPTNTPAISINSTKNTANVTTDAVTNIITTPPPTTTSFVAPPIPTASEGTITSPPTAVPATTATPINSKAPRESTTKPTVTPTQPTPPPGTTTSKKFAASSLSSFTMGSTVAATAVGVAILVLVYRKMRRRNTTYVPLQNNASP
ncbi:hypothetical protein DYB37_004985 [Aphanomyces astaci]|uniref:Uncharacterized protein n=1 Tax=Aphanomyces astaci TaxID=112090 RepID=A0A3R6WLJ2_APHAT|nr:hypothetical protein DYB35_007243 [Aphanomyces astaci]RHZ18966.1 hypothetical protein DYB37_004985 [Aphanomyces astaci]